MSGAVGQSVVEKAGRCPERCVGGRNRDILGVPLLQDRSPTPLPVSSSGGGTPRTVLHLGPGEARPRPCLPHLCLPCPTYANFCRGSEWTARSTSTQMPRSEMLLSRKLKKTQSNQNWQSREGRTQPQTDGLICQAPVPGD